MRSIQQFLLPMEKRTKYIISQFWGFITGNCSGNRNGSSHPIAARTVEMNSKGANEARWIADVRIDMASPCKKTNESKFLENLEHVIRRVNYFILILHWNTTTQEMIIQCNITRRWPDGGIIHVHTDHPCSTTTLTPWYHLAHHRHENVQIWRGLAVPVQRNVGKAESWTAASSYLAW